jgi:hypothetical protein
MKAVGSVLKAVWRSSGSVVAGAALMAWLQSPWGLVLTPALQGISKTLKQYYTARGKPVPPLVAGLPF